MASNNNLFCSSQFLSLQIVKGKEKLEWKGSLQNLQSFFGVFLTSLKYSDAQIDGVWSIPKGLGKPYKATFSDFFCTWYAEKFTLLLQGKRADFIRSELKRILDNPIKFGKDSIPAKRIEERLEEKEDETIEQSAILAKEQTVLEQIKDGMVRGKDVKLVIDSKLRYWSHKKYSIVIITPFLDSESLSFLKNCIPGEASIKIYVRKDCQWDSNIEQVVRNSKLSSCWAANHIRAISKAPSFHAKFLAGVTTDSVDLLLTSCNITKDHLDSNQLETLQRKDLSCEDFNQYWMGPLQMLCEENHTVQFVDDQVDTDLSCLMKKASLM